MMIKWLRSLCWHKYKRQSNGMWDMSAVRVPSLDEKGGGFLGLGVHFKYQCIKCGKLKWK